MNEIVRSYLIELARHRTNQTVTYQKLSDDCKLKLRMSDGPHVRKEIGKILGDISTYEHKAKRPLLSALVLRAGDNYEGDGFYKLAEDLGYGDWKDLKSNGFFEIREMNKCIEFWTKENNLKEFK